MLRRIPYGSLVRLEDLSGRFNYMLRGMSFVVEDTMHPRKYGQVDVWFPAYGQAISWGVRQVRLTVVRYGRG
jgi:3D (Asp-Asp-Asp) domain-containing protein